MTNAITKHNNPFLALRNELDRVMKDFYNPGIFEDLKLHPLVDLVDDKDHFKVEIEMPGMGEEDIKVSIADGILTIKGEKSTSKKDEGKNYITREISYGNYERHISLPASVDIDKAKASFKKGMLWVTIPKTAGSTQHSHEIKVEKE